MASKVHRVRYYNPKPHSINCASLNKKNKLLAVARENASIEIWDLKYAPYCVKFIPGVENGSVEALGWVNDRLLSTGLGGALVEWDLDRLCPKTTVLLTGYAAWCLDVHVDNLLVAVGTEQGYINLYNVANEEITYEKLFDKQEGRIMCCKFDKTGKILVTGSVDTIRIWDLKTGHATTRISARRRGKETIVWCLAVLSDNVVVSGDSHGRLTFWDYVMGDQIETFVSHKSDILSLVVSDDEKNLYCAGVDPVIQSFVKMNNNKAKNNPKIQWMKHVHRNIHEHDIRSLLLCGETLVSLGADGYLSLSSFSPKWVMRIPPITPMPRSSVSMKKRLLLLRYTNYVEVWKLGTYARNAKGHAVLTCKTQKSNIKKIEQSDMANKVIEKDTTLAAIEQQFTQDKQALEILESPMKLVTIQTKHGKQIQCCDISPNGEFIVYATESHLRMLKLGFDEQCNTSLSKVLISGLDTSCDRLAFTPDSQKLVAHSTGTLHVLNVDPEAGATVLYRISTEKHLKSKSILHLYISQVTASNAVYLVVADTEGAIAVWKLSNKKFEHYVTLPKYHCIPSAVTVDPKNENLFAVYVDQKIVEFELVQKRVSSWAGWSVPGAWRGSSAGAGVGRGTGAGVDRGAGADRGVGAGRGAALLRLQAHPARDALVCQDDTALWILDKNKDTPQAKRKFREEDSEIGLRIIPIKYLADFHWLDKDEAVLLEVSPENIVSQLPPPCIYRKW